MKPSDLDGEPIDASEEEVLRVLKSQANKQQAIEAKLNSIGTVLDGSIAHSEQLLTDLGEDVPAQPIQRPPSRRSHGRLRSWPELVAEAKQMTPDPVEFGDVLTEEEVCSGLAHLSAYDEEFSGLHRLDAIDLTIAGTAGLLAALADVFLVGIPRHAGFLGSRPSEGGPLSNFIRDKLREATPPAELAHLERELWVPYDPATSARLLHPVAGLGPRTHRFQSPGHWPVMGFLFGVRDILCGEFTAIDKSGTLIRQVVDNKDASTAGMSIFEALGRVYGHNFRTDMPTAQGLPAPLMGLFQFLQVGKIGRGDKTIGEVARLMYAQHYDFGHFLAMSLPGLLLEVMVRLGYMLKRLHEGHSLGAALPVGAGNRMKKPKLKTMLFAAHMVATLGNAGKIAVLQTPMAVNYPQWVAFFKYSIQQLAWGLHGRERERARFVQNRLDARWASLDSGLSASWGDAFGETVALGA